MCFMHYYMIQLIVHIHFLTQIALGYRYRPLPTIEVPNRELVTHHVVIFHLVLPE